MKAKIKSMHIEFIATFKNGEGEWEAHEFTHDVDGYDGKVTKKAAENALAQRHDGSENMFYNILTYSAVTKVINI